MISILLSQGPMDGQTVVVEDQDELTFIGIANGGLREYTYKRTHRILDKALVFEFVNAK